MPKPAFAALSLAVLLAAALSACSDQQPLATRDPSAVPVPFAQALQAFECTGTTAGTLSCRDAGANDGQARGSVIIGGQNVYLKLTSSNVSYDSTTNIFQFNVTVQNLLNEAIGTPNGTVADTLGIRVFFASGPTVTEGSGSVVVANPDGFDTFTATNQPYFTYNEILAKNAVSSARTWQLHVVGPVSKFAFVVYVATEVQYLLVINEMMTNPGGTITDANGEWVELYNAGTLSVNLQNLVIADSGATGRAPYHRISASRGVLGGRYVVLGKTTNTTSNGGVNVDYGYGAALQFSNAAADAFKISRVYGTDTLTIDRTAYTNSAISAQDGISRELKNPALGNANMDNNNWADAAVSSVYGAGGRGTPRAQNAAFTP